MTKKNLFLIGVTLALAVVYGVFFTDWFRTHGIQISHTSRPVPQQRAANPRLQAIFESSAPVTFFFRPELRLTRLKVFAVSELETNRYALPVWHMVSESNTPPVDSLVYGITLRGMHPANKGQFAQPLVPGVNYRLLVEAGDLKGQHDFVPRPKLTLPR